MSLDDDLRRYMQPLAGVEGTVDLALAIVARALAADPVVSSRPYTLSAKGSWAHSTQIETSDIDIDVRYDGPLVLNGQTRQQFHDHLSLETGDLCAESEDDLPDSESVSPMQWRREVAKALVRAFDDVVAGSMAIEVQGEMTGGVSLDVVPSVVHTSFQGSGHTQDAVIHRKIGVWSH